MGRPERVKNPPASRSWRSPWAVRSSSRTSWPAGGSRRWRSGRLDVPDPSDGTLLARVPRSEAADVDAAIRAARAAFPAWREVPVAERARRVLALRALLETHADDLARTVSRENGKTLDEARGSVRRGIEATEFAASAPTTTQGYFLEDVSHGVDTTLLRQPVGRRRRDHPVQLPGDDPALDGAARPRLRQLLRPQAVGTRSPLRRAPRPARLGGGIPCPARSTWSTGIQPPSMRFSHTPGSMQCRSSGRRPRPATSTLRRQPMESGCRHSRGRRITCSSSRMRTSTTPSRRSSPAPSANRESGASRAVSSSRSSPVPTGWWSASPRRCGRSRSVQARQRIIHRRRARHPRGPPRPGAPMDPGGGRPGGPSSPPGGRPPRGRTASTSPLSCSTACRPGDGDRAGGDLRPGALRRPRPLPRRGDRGSRTGRALGTRPRSSLAMAGPPDSLSTKSRPGCWV